MKQHALCAVFVVVIAAILGVAQTTASTIVPEITTQTIEAGEVTVLHLSPGFTTSVRVPEPIRSVVLGNPAAFKAEYSETEARMLFLKPIISRAASSNALITTRSGQEISLELVSDGQGASGSHVDFVVEYRRPTSVLIAPAGSTSFEVSGGTQSTVPMEDARNHVPDPVLLLLAKQETTASPPWEGDALQVAVGALNDNAGEFAVAFSVRNRSTKSIELLPPQLQLNSVLKGEHGNQIKAEPVPIKDYRISTRKLAPEGRADGVIVFDRPAFKEFKEKLLLQIAAADAVDRPVLALVPFVAPAEGGVR